MSSRDKIIIFRALKLGDMLCSVPAIRGIRKSFPNSHIAIASHPQMESFFKRFPHYVDEFISFSGFPGMSESPEDPESVVRTIQFIQERQFDLAIQLHGSGELTNSVVQLFKAKRSLGYYRDGHYRPDLSFPPYPEDIHEVERCLRLLEIIGVNSSDHDLEYPLSSDDYERLTCLYDDYSLFNERPYICLHPGASTESKRWSPENFSRLGDWLYERGFNIVFTGSSFESKVVHLIQSSMRYKSFDAASVNLPLPELAALVRKSAGVICNDTGISHLCSALKVPSIVIFIETSPSRWAPLNRSLHKWLWKPKFEDVQKKANQFFIEEVAS